MDLQSQVDCPFECDSVDNFTPAMEYSSDSEGDMTADDDVQSDQSASESDSGN